MYGVYFTMKKGFIGDIFTNINMFFLIALTLIICFFAFTVILDGFQAGGISNQAIESVYNSYKLFDYFFLIIVIIALLTTMISAYMIDTHPVFFVFTLFFMLFAFVLGSALSNAYTVIASSSGLATASNQFYYTGLIMTNLNVIIGGFIVGFLIALYAKVKLS